MWEGWSQRSCRGGLFWRCFVDKPLSFFWPSAKQTFNFEEYNFSQSTLEQVGEAIAARSSIKIIWNEQANPANASCRCLWNLPGSRRTRKSRSERSARHSSGAASVKMAPCPLTTPTVSCTNYERGTRGPGLWTVDRSRF